MYDTSWWALFEILEITQALHYTAKDSVFYVSEYGYQTCFYTIPSQYIEKFTMMSHNENFIIQVK